MGQNNNFEELGIDNLVINIKYQILNLVAQFEIEGTLSDKKHDIPEIVSPGKEPITTRCCIYHERACIKDRVKLTIAKDDDISNIINVIPSACDECSIYRYKVTEACRGCLNNNCKHSCKFGAIRIVDGRACIDQHICKECGKCHEACPYEAISDVRRPCIKACQPKAISISDDKKAIINDDKCIQCGACITACPFGAIKDKSYISDIISLLKNKTEKTYAVVAPAIASQFPKYTMGQIKSAIKKMGFEDVIEAAFGGDLVAKFESEEYLHKLEEHGIMTTSCCPAFLSYIRKNYPELIDIVSTTISPMIATGRYIKANTLNAKVVFIGPCVAKKEEAKQEDVNDAIDVVMTFEELLAVLDAYKIRIADCEEQEINDATPFGRNFAVSGGVTEAVLQAIKEKNIDIEVKPAKCNGLKECDTSLRLAKLKKIQANFIEGMACEGGCMSGPGCITVTNTSKKLINAFSSTSSNDSIEKVCEDININMERNYSILQQI